MLVISSFFTYLLYCAYTYHGHGVKCCGAYRARASRRRTGWWVAKARAGSVTTSRDSHTTSHELHTKSVRIGYAHVKCGQSRLPFL